MTMLQNNLSWYIRHWTFSIFTYYFPYQRLATSFQCIHDLGAW